MQASAQPGGEDHFPAVTAVGTVAVVGRGQPTHSHADDRGAGAGHSRCSQHNDRRSEGPMLDRAEDVMCLAVVINKLLDFICRNVHSPRVHLDEPRGPF